MCLTVNLSETGRNRLGVAVCVCNVILFMASICLIVAGIYIQVHVNDELILLESYNSGVLPNFIVSVGSIMFLLNIISAKIAYDSGFDATREKFRMTLIPLVVLMLLTSIVLLASGIVCLSHRSSIENALHDGLMDSIKRYKDSLPVKITIDKMQMFSKCCGSRSYKDWFIVSWIGNDFVDNKNHLIRRKVVNGHYYTDDVPFSCCDAKSNRPCITEKIQTHSKRDKPEMTLHKNGCTDSLMDDMEKMILQPVGFYIMAMFGLQILMTILLRYLQTSIEDSYLEGDTEGPGKAYFCPNFCPSCLTTGDPNKYIKQGALDKGKRNVDELDDTDQDNTDTVLDIDGPPGVGNFGDYGDIGDMGGGGGGGVGGEHGGHHGGGHDGHDGGHGGKHDKAGDKRKSKDKKSRSKSPKSKKSKSEKPKKLKKPKKPKAPKSPKRPKVKKPKSPKKPKMKKTKSPKKPKMKKPKSPKKPKMKSPRAKKAKFGRKK